MGTFITSVAGALFFTVFSPMPDWPLGILFGTGGFIDLGAKTPEVHAPEIHQGRRGHGHHISCDQVYRAVFLIVEGEEGFCRFYQESSFFRNSWMPDQTP